MKRPAFLLSFILAADWVGFAQPVPHDVSALAVKAGLNFPVVDWCRAESRTNDSGGYAVAVAFPQGGGRYAVVESNAAAFELATFARTADLSCYSPGDAKKLNRTIARSRTVQGRIALRWKTTVVCGFIDDTTAVCWQYSPVDAKFVEVGGWST